MIIRYIIFGAFLCGLLLALSEAFPRKSVVATDMGSFIAANNEAGKIEHDPAALKYRREAYYPYFSKKYSLLMNDCYRNIASPSSGTFAFILMLDTSGKVESIALDKSTNLSECLTKKLAVETFPPPPFSPFYERVNMDIKP